VCQLKKKKKEEKEKKKEEKKGKKKKKRAEIRDSCRDFNPRKFTSQMERDTFRGSYFPIANSLKRFNDVDINNMK